MAASTDTVGDTTATALSLTLGQRVESRFDSPQDIDMFSFQVRAGASYTVGTSWSYYVADAPLGRVNFVAPAQMYLGVGQLNTASSISFTAAVSGTYYVKTSQYYPDALPFDYALSVSEAEDDYLAAAGTSGALAADGGASAIASGVLNNVADQDWFAVDLAAGTTYSFALAGASLAAPQIKLLNASRTVMAEPSGSAPGAAAAQLSYTPATSGTYYLQVSDLKSGTGAYTVQASGGVPDDYGNSAATAAALKLGMALSGQLETKGDTDVFKLAAERGSTYLLELAPANSADLYQLSLSGASPFFKASMSSYLVYNAATSGDLILTVDNPSNSRAAGYTLKASAAPNDDFAGSSATSGVLTGSARVAGALDFVGDADWLKYSVKAGKQYEFHLAGAGNGGTLNTGSGGGMLDFHADDPNSFLLQPARSDASGKYYSYTSSITGDVYLSVEAVRGIGSLGSPTATGSYTVQISEVDRSGPTVLSMSPQHGTSGASPSANIVLQFDEAVRRGDGAIRLFDSKDTLLETFSGSTGAAVDGATLTINPSAMLRPGTGYRLELSTGSVTDMAGNQFAGATGRGAYLFTTAAAVPAGGDGNDYLLGLGSGLRLAGRDGIDTAVYAEARSAYQVLHIMHESKVTKGSGALGDLLSGVERLLFRDTAVALDIDGSAGQAYRLYQAAFNRVPDKEGLGFWIAHMDRGMSLRDVAASFIGSSEFAAQYGVGSSDQAFISSLYKNALGRAPEEAGMAFWLDKLSHGLSRADALTGFSESNENQANTLPLIGNGFDYIPYG